METFFRLIISDQYAYYLQVNPSDKTIPLDDLIAKMLGKQKIIEKVKIDEKLIETIFNKLFVSKEVKRDFDEKDHERLDNLMNIDPKLYHKPFAYPTTDGGIEKSNGEGWFSKGTLLSGRNKNGDEIDFFMELIKKKNPKLWKNIKGRKQLINYLEIRFYLQKRLLCTLIIIVQIKPKIIEAIID